MAERAGKCQNKETKENCLAREYITQGVDQCACLPYKLRNITYHSTEVSGKIWLYSHVFS